MPSRSRELAGSGGRRQGEVEAATGVERAAASGVSAWLRTHAAAYRVRGTAARRGHAAGGALAAGGRATGLGGKPNCGNTKDHRQFKQRYYEFLDYYRAPNGPIFLYICGEASCNGIGNDYLAVMAKKFGAALVSPEHRYYGKSSPFNSLTTENLQFLSSKQALFDLAVFRQYYQETLNAKYNRSGADSSWFVFGGSYAGALSAWFRLKFPHLTCGSLASSGVVLSVYNYTDFDKQIGISAGPECKAALQEITRLVDGQLQSGRNSVKELFGAPKGGYCSHGAVPRGPPGPAPPAITS